LDAAFGREEDHRGECDLSSAHPVADAAPRSDAATLLREREELDSISASNIEVFARSARGMPDLAYAYTAIAAAGT
jgi:hypothetical protein